ncbi:Gfo/Idh/MocA family protein [Microvirga sp. 17 mud 1-3]|uniref:Gfo/Idh/MocA family protein n=1 Tax=Microvirga sp. 17 mud 1-3 TaxID=2082949 RepID=UPI000D6B91BB|nr:Gfo/Idh/MocA family oxidoreductase [Microvirga sp. 17 mud 1-3]AWM87689.1 oxidoreductase [Microvirga sp. 17 mud 1-3]
MDLSTLRVGVIGVGIMGQNHVRVLSEMTAIELVAISDPNTEAFSKLRLPPQTRTYSDYSELLAHDLDAVVVAVPTVHHHSIVMKALERGINVLVEKPIASTIAQAEEMVALADDRQLVLMVGHIERFNPAVQAVKTALTHERPISISITRVGPFPPRIADVGIIVDLGVHDIDLIRYLSDSDIVDVQVQKEKTRGLREDIALMQFRTQNNILAQINTNWLTPFKERRIEVSGREQFISCDMLTRSVVTYSDYKTDGSFVTRHLSVAQIEPLRAELLAFSAAVRKNSTPPVTGRDGLQALKAALACLEEA